MASKQKVKAEKKETVYIPKTQDNANGEFVSINGRTWKVPTGKQVQVPACAAAVLRDSDAMKAVVAEDKIAHSK